MPQSFQGFCEDTFTFLLDLRFHNEKSFFHAQHNRYEQVLKNPLYALAEDLAPVLSDIDEQFELRPRMVVSHINRDVRYSKNKAPYRDHMWLSWHLQGKNKRDCLAPFFAIDLDGYTMGMGFWQENKEGMESFRNRMCANPSALLDILHQDMFSSRYAMVGEAYKRKAAPEALPEELKKLYILKSFDAQMHGEITPQMFEASFLDTIAQSLAALKPLYHFIMH